MSEVQLRIDTKVLESLHKHNLTIEEFFLLKCLNSMASGGDLMLSYTRGKNNAQKIAMMQSLVRKKMIEVDLDFYILEEQFDFSHYRVTQLGKLACNEISRVAVASAEFVSVKTLESHTLPSTQQFLKNDYDKQVEDFNDFVKKYIELFPKGVKNGGNKTLRSNFDDVKTKLIKFFNKYKRFDKANVLKATEIFLRKFRNDFTYCPTAEYFVMKDNSSALATECDSLKNSIDAGEDVENNSSPFEQLM